MYTTPKVWLCIAMESEWQAVRAHGVCASHEQVEVSPYPVYRHAESDIAVIITGIGTVNSGAAMQYVISTYGPATAYINVGIAGGVSAQVQIGHAYPVIATRFFDVDVTAFGYEHGQLPGTAQATYTLAAMPDTSSCMVASGQSFVTDFLGTYKHRIPVDVDIVEMELAGLAHVLVRNLPEAPLYAIKGISDHATSDAAQDIDVNIEQAMHAVGEKLVSLLQYLGVR